MCKYEKVFQLGKKQGELFLKTKHQIDCHRLYPANINLGTQRYRIKTNDRYYLMSIYEIILVPTR